MGDSPAPVVKLTDAEKMEALTAAVINGSSLNAAIKVTFGDRRKYHEAITKDPKLRLSAATAMELRGDHLADEIVEISDTEPDPQRARNRIGARTWLASKLNPKSYGERIELALQHNISITDALNSARSRVSAIGPVMDAEIVPTPALADNPTPDPEPDIIS